MCYFGSLFVRCDFNKLENNNVLIYSLDHEVTKEVNSCPVTGVTIDPKIECNLVGDAKSDSQFFVTTGVLTFLYATGIGAVYLLADTLYTENSRVPMIVSELILYYTNSKLAVVFISFLSPLHFL